MIRPTVFVDTSGWGHYFIRKEFRHHEAQSLVYALRKEGHRFVTTNYILAELVALMQSPLKRPRHEQIEAVESIREETWIKIIHIDETLDQLAWELFRSRREKSWSLVDCASFVVMQQENILYALSTDHHFEQAGFINLLK